MRRGASSSPAWLRGVVCAVPLVLAGCEPVPPVQVQTEDGRAIMGATVAFGSGDSALQFRTDEEGEARVLSQLFDRQARILALNHFPQTVTLTPGAYRLGGTRGLLRRVGEVPAQAVRIHAGSLFAATTEEGKAKVRRLGFSKLRVVEQSVAEQAAEPQGELRFTDDEWWVQRGERAADVWSLADPAAPRWLRRVEGEEAWLARRGALVVARPAQPGLWAVQPSGALVYVADLPLPAKPVVHGGLRPEVHAAFVGEALYVMLHHPTLTLTDLLVYDVRDPARPVETHRERLPRLGGTAVLRGTRVFLPEPDGLGDVPTGGHVVLEVEDPFHPTNAVSVSLPARLQAVLPGGFAVGALRGTPAYALLGFYEREPRSAAPISVIDVEHTVHSPPVEQASAASGRLAVFGGWLWELTLCLPADLCPPEG